MAPISAITANRIYTVSTARDSAELTNVSDEFSALFEGYVPGFEVNEGETAEIDTSITVAPLQTVAQPTEVRDQQAEFASFEDPAEETAVYGNHRESEDSSMRNQNSLVSQDSNRDNESGDAIENQDVSADAQDTDVGESQVEAKNSAETAHVEARGVEQEVKEVVPSSEIQASAVSQITAESDVEAAAASSSSQGVTAENISAEDAEGDLKSATQTKAPDVRADLSKGPEKPEKPENLVPITKEAQQQLDARKPAQAETRPAIENPVFGSMKSEGDELTKVLLSKQESSTSEREGIQASGTTRGNSPLLEVLMNQVQRLSTQGVFLGADRPELNLGSRSNIQLGQVQGLAAVGANLSARAETDARPAKVARQAPAAGVRTMERVQKALADGVAAQDGKTISLRLDPPELGKVKVDLSFRGGNLSARIVAESAGITSLLRERAHELQHTLRKLGIEANNVTVSISTDSGQGESRANFDGDRRQEQFERGTLEQEMVESLLVEEELEEGKLAMDHRVA